jgi:hypothetical protein
MEEEKKDEGLKEGETPETQPTSKETPSESNEDLQNTKEEKTDVQKAEELLKDGTPSSKNFTIPKERYDELRAVEDVHKQMLEDSAATKDGLQKDVEELKRERAEEKRNELRSAVTEAISRWPDFDKSWTEVKNISDALMKQGVPAKDAIRRGYIAIHPEAAQAEAERITQERVNNLGTFATPTTQSPTPTSMSEGKKLTEGEKLVAQNRGIDPVEYAKKLVKYDSWLRQRNLYDSRLDKEL